MRKYLFVVHSSITWRMARSVMDMHGWMTGQCILLTDRGYEPENTSFEQYPIDQWPILPLRWEERNVLRQRCRTNRANRKALDTLISEQIGQPYYLFLPHTWSYAYLALREHPLCERYFLIEEGTLSYRRDLSIYQHQPGRLRRWLLRGLLDRCGGRQLPVYPVPLEIKHPSYGGCYGMHEDSFPALPAASRSIVPSPFAEVPAFRSYRQVLITGPWLELQYCNEGEYRLFVRALLAYFARSEHRKLFVKYHPRQYTQGYSIEIFRTMAEEFSGHIAMHELEPSISPEEIAYSSRADFYLAYSSLSIYANRFGCRTFSYARQLADRWPAFRRVYENLPAVITDSLIPIELPFTDLEQAE